MVNYSDPLMRDETYRRWKGGSKLADALRDFYTSDAAKRRLGMATNGAAILASTPARLTHRQWNERVRESGRLERGKSPRQRLELIQQMLSQKMPDDQAPAGQSGATLR